MLFVHFIVDACVQKYFWILFYQNHKIKNMTDSPYKNESNQCHGWMQITLIVQSICAILFALNGCKRSVLLKK